MFKLALGLFALVIMMRMMPTPIQGQSHFIEYSVTAVKVSPNGEMIAKANHEGALTLYAVETAHIVQTLQSSGTSIQDLAWSPDGARIASVGFYGQVMMWDVALGSSIFSVNVAETGDVTTSVKELVSVSWSPNGEQIAVSGQAAGTAILDASTGSRLFTLKTGETYSNVWHPFSNLITAGLLGIQAWSDGTLVAERSTLIPLDIAISSDASALAVLQAQHSDEGLGKLFYELQIIDPNMLSVISTVEIPEHQSRPLRVIWSQDNQHLLISNFDGHARVWERSTLSVIDEINVENEIMSITWASDSEIVYASGDDLVIEAIATPIP